MAFNPLAIDFLLGRYVPPKRDVAKSPVSTKGVLFQGGLWRATYKTVYLGCYLTSEDACKVRLAIEQTCAEMPKPAILTLFNDMVAAGELPKPVVRGSSNARHPRGHRFTREEAIEAQKRSQKCK